MKVGRDPGSDIIVRDARVSRHHAEIVFERGFFVLRDLDSANGSFVNGKRIRNAPLTDGAEILLGDTRGKFSEGLDEQLPKTETSPGDDERHTRPVPLTAEKPPEDSLASIVEERKGWSGNRFIFEVGDEPSAWMIEEATRRRFRFRNPRSLISLVTTLVSLTVAIAGVSVSLFLIQQSSYTRAAIASLLTIVFGMMIAALIPRRRFTMRDVGSGDPLVTLQQRNSSPALLSTFEATAAGAKVATFHKNVFANLGRRRWSILDGVGSSIGYAIEDSLLRAILRKPFGSFIGALRTDFEIKHEERELGRFRRRGEKAGRRYVLELRDAELDRSIAVSLGLLLTCVER